MNNIALKVPKVLKHMCEVRIASPKATNINLEPPNMSRWDLQNLQEAQKFQFNNKEKIQVQDQLLVDRNNGIANDCGVFQESIALACEPSSFHSTMSSINDVHLMNQSACSSEPHLV